MIKIIRTIAIGAIAVTALSVTGCSRITILRTTELKGVQDTLKMELVAAQNLLIEEQNKLLAEQNKLLEEQKTIAEILRLLRADQVVRFNQIDKKVSAIESNLLESHSRISRLDQQTAEVHRRLERRLAMEEEAANQLQLQIEKLFEIAMSDFNAGRYDIAIGGFQDLMTQYSDSPLAIDAEYWIAESHFAKKDYEAAEKAYFDFIRNHPDAEKNCVSLYKLGLAYERQTKTRSRDMVWGNLLDRCPEADEAQLVKEQMGAR
jgi:tol-pal system protein YbgF